MVRPVVIILGGPNGAGKSTLAPVLLKERIGLEEFVNADRNFANLHNQMARAAISVVSNIAEGAGATTDPGRERRMADARGSNRELQVQLELLVDEDHPLTDRVDHVGRMLTRLIQRLE